MKEWKTKFVKFQWPKNEGFQSCHVAIELCKRNPKALYNSKVLHKIPNQSAKTATEHPTYIHRWVPECTQQIRSRNKKRKAQPKGAEIVFFCALAKFQIAGSYV